MAPSKSNWLPFKNEAVQSFSFLPKKKIKISALKMRNTHHNIRQSSSREGGCETQTPSVVPKKRTTTHQLLSAINWKSIFRRPTLLP